MTLVPSNTRFIGFSQEANLAENKTANLNAISQPFTMQDIADASGNYEVTDPFYNDPSIKASFVTVNGAFSGVTDVDGYSAVFENFSTDQYTGCIVTASIFGFGGYASNGTLNVSFANGGSYIERLFANIPSYDPGLGLQLSEISPSNYGFIVAGPSEGIQFEIIYSIKFFRLPMFYDL